ncbi:MAG: HAD family hydrolase [Thermodesulfobacteriota bacterium]
MIKALAMDANGVLYYRNEEVVDSVQRYLKEKIGLRFDEAATRSYYFHCQDQAFEEKISIKEMMRRYVDFLGVRDPQIREEIPAKIMHFSERIHLFPEEAATLRELKKRGVILGVISNSIHSAEEKMRWFAKAGIGSLIDIMISSIDEKCKKPDEAIYRIFLDRAGLSPGEAAFMGHDEKEIRPAQRLGLTTICFKCSRGIADYNLKSFAKLLNVPGLPP